MKNSHYTIIFTALFVALAFYTYQIKTESNGLKKAVESLNNQFELQKKQNQRSFDSIQNHIVDFNKKVVGLEKELPGLEQKIETINRRSNENKNRIHNITSADTISLILTRRYRQ